MDKINLGNLSDGNVLHAGVIHDLANKINELIEYCNRLSDSSSTKVVIINDDYSGGDNGDADDVYGNITKIQNLWVTPGDESDINDNIINEEELYPREFRFTVYYNDSGEEKHISINAYSSDLKNQSSDTYLKLLKIFGNDFISKIEIETNLLFDSNVGSHIYPPSIADLNTLAYNNEVDEGEYNEYGYIVTYPQTWAGYFCPTKFNTGIGDNNEIVDPYIDENGLILINNIPTLFEAYKYYSNRVLEYRDLRNQSRNPDDYDRIAINTGHLGKSAEEFTGNYTWQGELPGNNGRKIASGVYIKDLAISNPTISITENLKIYTNYDLSLNNAYYRNVLVEEDYILKNMFFIIKHDEYESWLTFKLNYKTLIPLFIDNARITNVSFDDYGKYYFNDPWARADGISPGTTPIVNGDPKPLSTDNVNGNILRWACNGYQGGHKVYGTNHEFDSTKYSTYSTQTRPKYDLFARLYWSPTKNNTFVRGYMYNSMLQTNSWNPHVCVEEGDILVFLNKASGNSGVINRTFSCMGGDSDGYAVSTLTSDPGGYMTPEGYQMKISPAINTPSESDYFAQYLGCTSDDYILSTLENNRVNGSIVVNNYNSLPYVSIPYEESIIYNGDTYKRYGGRDYNCFIFRVKTDRCLLFTRFRNPSGLYT